MRAGADVCAGTRVLVETRAGEVLTGEILCDYSPGRGFDLQPDDGSPIHLPASRLRPIAGLREVPGAHGTRRSVGPRAGKQQGAHG